MLPKSLQGPLAQKNSRKNHGDPKTKSSNCSKKKRNCRSKQRFAKGQATKEAKEIPKIRKHESKQFQQTLQHITFYVEESIKQMFGFLLSPYLSINLNAYAVLGNTIADLYFYRSNNLAFHDQTTTKSIPSAAREVLGLGLEYISTPKILTTKHKAAQAAEQVSMSVLLKAVYS